MQPVDARVAALLSTMTNAEKQAQTIHLTGVDIATAPQYGATGLGAYPGIGLRDAGEPGQAEHGSGVLPQPLTAGHPSHIPL